MARLTGIPFEVAPAPSPAQLAYQQLQARQDAWQKQRQAQPPGGALGSLWSGGQASAPPPPPPPPLPSPRGAR